MKIALKLLASLAVVLIALVLLERWDEGTNRGCTWGYWGEFNTVSNCVAKLPGVTVVKAWWNADFLVLEEFGFDILTHGKEVSLGFGEKDPTRRLSGPKLERALLEMISKESSTACSGREPAVAVRLYSSRSGGWLPSLMLSVGGSRPFHPLTA